jgi:hypothetical protein
VDIFSPTSDRNMLPLDKRSRNKKDDSEKTLGRRIKRVPS